ncbi:MAG: GNAT family N-acetyltransferase [Chloroflexi bacterium]|nr:GNAT family N-acetyltransferase [Chloroflexota bacterium]
MAIATSTVRLQPHQITESGEVLGRAFFDDPMTSWCVPNDEVRARALPWFFAKATAIGHRWGEVHTTAGVVEGSAIWLPPGKTKVTMGQMWRTRLLLAPLKFGPAGFMRFMKIMNTFEHLHDRDMPDPHWYLFVLGVDPPRQGQGLGGVLMGDVLARADGAGLPCYLETQKPINVPFYQKHGFDVVVEDDIPNGPHYWTMKRQPR